MTAVAGSSNKVGGKKTLIVVLRPLQLSAQLRAQLPKTYAVALAVTKNIKIARFELVTVERHAPDARVTQVCRGRGLDRRYGNARLHHQCNARRERGTAAEELFFCGSFARGVGASPLDGIET